MSADWWIMAGLGAAVVVLTVWHAKLEQKRAIERCDAALRGERKMHMEIETNVLNMRNDALRDLRFTRSELDAANVDIERQMDNWAGDINDLHQCRIDLGEYQRENAELRRRLARPKGPRGIAIPRDAAQ